MEKQPKPGVDNEIKEGFFEIKKKFRMLSIMVHPDKCRHEKASDAFHLLE